METNAKALEPRKKNYKIHRVVHEEPMLALRLLFFLKKKKKIVLTFCVWCCTLSSLSFPAGSLTVRCYTNVGEGAVFVHMYAFDFLLKEKKNKRERE